MATRDDEQRERAVDEPREATPDTTRDRPRDEHAETSGGEREVAAPDIGEERGTTSPDTVDDRGSVDVVASDDGDGDVTVIGTDDTLTVSTGEGSADWVIIDSGQQDDAADADDVDDSADADNTGHANNASESDEADPDDPAGLDLSSQTLPGSLQDHLGMQVQEDHIPDIEGHRALVDGGLLPGPAAGNLPGGAELGNFGYDPGSVRSSPGDDKRMIDDDTSPFGRSQDPFAGFDRVAGRPSSLYDNPNVVGADWEAKAQAAANPDLTGLVDIEAIAGGQVGGTIDGRTPDGGGGGHGSGFAATSGYDPTNLLDGATSQGLTNPHAAAAAVQQGVEEFGHGGFTVYDLHTGAAVYGPGVSAGTGPSIPAGSGPAGQYVIVQKGAQFDGGQLAPSSTSPLSAPVKTGGSEGVVPQGGESAHASDPWFQKVASWFIQGSPSSPKAEALQQSEQTIQETSGAPPEVPERPDEGPETELPADPDAGSGPPPGLDLSREWAISVWARQNADVNPNPMQEASAAGSAQSMDISEVVEQYEEAPLAPPNIDPDAQIGPDISEQFTEFDG